MAIVQSNLGTWSGTSINVTLASNSDAANRVVVFLMGNDVTTAGSSGFTQRETNVGSYGQFLYDKVGDGTAAWTLSSNSGGGGGVWIAVEVKGGVYDKSSSLMSDASGSTSAMTATITPASGRRLILASVGAEASAVSDYFTAWSNSYVETTEGSSPTGPTEHGVASVEAVYDGVATTNTTATLASSSSYRYRIIASYLTTEDTPPGTVYDVEGTTALVIDTPSAAVAMRATTDPQPSQWVFDVPRATVTGGTAGSGGTGRTDGPTTLTGELNRLAGRTMGINWLSATGAANVWAGTTNLSLVDALHVKAGITDLKTYMDLQGVCNVLGGITDPKNWQAPAGALARRES